VEVVSDMIDMIDGIIHIGKTNYIGLPVAASTYS